MAMPEYEVGKTDDFDDDEENVFAQGGDMTSSADFLGSTGSSKQQLGGAPGSGMPMAVATPVPMDSAFLLANGAGGGGSSAGMDTSTGREGQGGGGGQGRGGEQDGEGGFGSFCGCLSIKFYKRFFDVDTGEVLARWKYSGFPFRRDATFLELLDSRPDAYGPFWNATTLIFIIAIMTNLYSWLTFDASSGSEWEYDITKLVTCASIVYGFLFVVPLVVWLCLSQLEVPIAFMDLFCIYGYSCGVFIPAVVLCLVPSDGFVWCSLCAACLLSVVFLLRAVTPVMMERNSENAAVLVLGGFGAIQIVFMLLLKLIFFPHAILST